MNEKIVSLQAYSQKRESEKQEGNSDDDIVELVLDYKPAFIGFRRNANRFREFIFSFCKEHHLELIVSEGKMMLLGISIPHFHAIIVGENEKIEKLRKAYQKEVWKRR